MNMRNIFLLPLLVILLTGCASPNLLEISGSDMGKLHPTTPINRSLAAVSFDRNKVEVCLWCLKNYAWRDRFGNYWENLFDRTYPDFLKNVLNDAAIFDSHSQDSVSLKAKLVSFSQQDELGSSRAKLTVQYQLMNGNSVISTWNIHSLGHANHFAAMDNMYDAAYEAITQNIYMFSLILVADTSSADRERIKKEIEALNKKMETDNVSTGNIFMIGLGGAVYGVKAVADSAGAAWNDAAKSVSQACQNDPSLCNGQQNQAMIDSLNRGNQETARMLAQQRAIDEQAKAMQASAQGGASLYAPPPRQFTPGVVMGAAGDNSASSDDGSANASDHGTSSSGNSNSPSGSEHSSPKPKRKKYVFNGFNDGGVEAATSELAIEQDTAQVKRVAEKWVAERMNGTESAHAVITEMRVRECTAMGGNPLYRRCIVDVTYEADE